MKKLKIKTSAKKYPVFIGDSVLHSLTEKINQSGLYKNLFVVVDENVLRLYETYIKKAFQEFNGKVAFTKVSPGESSKSIDGLSSIFSELIKNNFGRDTLLIAVGGGVTGDLSGFAASIYMRGIQLIHIPTTLLACVDSAIGGKTGINYNSIKNIIGSFYQPELVIIDTNFLSGLPEDEIKSGTGEIIKYAFLTNKNFYSFIENNFEQIINLDKKVLNKVIYESVLFKGSVVSEDEHEGGLRKILNFGHTFAHAYESISNYSLKHGNAVSLGIISALYLSYKKNFISGQQLNHFLKVPLKMNYPKALSFKNKDLIINYMYGDKKNREGELRFVLLRDIGRIITDVNAIDSEVKYAIEMTEKIITK